MTRFSALVLCALVIASCRNNAANVVLASLDRSEKIDLLCGRVVQATGNQYRFYGALPLDLCDPDAEVQDVENAPDAEAQFLGAVTQTETGTVAVVNFSNGAIFDTSVTVPGVTALRVGEQPRAAIALRGQSEERQGHYRFRHVETVQLRHGWRRRRSW